MRWLGSVAFIVTSVQLGSCTSTDSQEEILENAWSQDLGSDGKGSPIQRVVKLLKEMKHELEVEAEKESEMYDQMVCWCETNEKEKVKAIADAEALDGDLSSEIEARSARSAELATTIAAMKNELTRESESLKEAVTIREKEAASFTAEERSTMQALTNLKNAIQVLSKHHSFLQGDSPVLASLRAVIRDAALKYDLMLGDIPKSHPGKAALLAVESRSSNSRRLLAEFNLQAEDDEAVPLDIAEHSLARTARGEFSEAALLQGSGAPSAGSYQPASSAVFGIMKQMKEEFEANLSQGQKDEMKAVQEFNDFRVAKEASIASGKEKLDNLEEEHAMNTKSLSDAKEDLDITRGQRSADVKFLRNLRLTCQSLDKEWEERSKTRTAEITAVSEALSIIVEDDTMDLLRKSVNLFQLHSNVEFRARRIHAAELLRRTARAPGFETDDLLDAWSHRGNEQAPAERLSTLAMTVELDAFGKVKEAIDQLLSEMERQQKEEVAEKALCTKELFDNEQSGFRKSQQKADLESAIENLGNNVAKLNEDIVKTRYEIGETKVEIKKASEYREKENAEFQSTVADQRATQAVLAKALAKLKAFYDKQALLQVVNHSLLQRKQTPPVKFDAYKKIAGASPVIGLIENIMQDSKKLELDAVAAETAAQRDYETTVKDANVLLSKLNDSITSKNDALAADDLTLANSKSDLESTIEEIDILAAFKVDLHKKCNFLLNNFDLRQRMRTREMEAIRNAKAILSGA